MASNEESRINHNQKPVEGYRGALVYRQEYEYKLATMMIDQHTSDERSSVISCVHDFDIPEEAEDLPAGLPLFAIDLYHFPATDGMEIELTIRRLAGVHKAYFAVDAIGVEEYSSFLWLDV